MTQITELKPSGSDMEFTCDICKEDFNGIMFTSTQRAYKYDDNGNLKQVEFNGEFYMEMCSKCRDKTVEVINNLTKGE